MPIPLISPEQFQKICESKKRENGTLPALVDVRTPVEFREVHAVQARNIPLDSLNPTALAGELNGNASQTVYFICRSGNRSRMACEQMMSAGFDDICSIDGGTSAWDSAGLPVQRGKAAMSLERQVRIAAGSLVALGGALALFVHPLWVLLPMAVGCGLVFAGVSDWCGMGMLLAKMPWNRVSGSCDTACCSRDQ